MNGAWAPQTQTFSGRSYTDQADFLVRHERVTGRHISAFMTAAREFAEQAQPTLRTRYALCVQRSQSSQCVHERHAVEPVQWPQSVQSLQRVQ